MRKRRFDLTGGRGDLSNWHVIGLIVAVVLICVNEGLRKLRIVAALTGERQYEVLDRLVSAELERVQKSQKPD